MAKSISLSCELGELAHVLEGGRLLCEGVTKGTLEDGRAEQVCCTLSATLTMAIARIRDLSRAVRGEIDPARLWAEHNCPTLGAADQDVVLAAWPPTPAGKTGRRAKRRR
jgi:hypothetical protein